MARVRDDGQVREFLEPQRAAEIEHIARMGIEAADTAFAQDDVGVPFDENVLGSVQHLVQCRRHGALEQDRFAGPRGSFEERKVLHVARADLNHVDVAREHG